MNRQVRFQPLELNRIPHTRGDEPGFNSGMKGMTACIPHTRGDEPKVQTRRGGSLVVFPTHVGMNRR